MKVETIEEKLRNTKTEHLASALTNDEIAYLFVTSKYAQEFSRKAVKLNAYLQATADDENISKEWGRDVTEIALERMERYRKQITKYKNVIRHLENAYQDMSDDETIGQDEWLGGWAAAVDFIEENIDWEETDEAKTIVEENKELSDRVQELERELEEHKSKFTVKYTMSLREQNKRYRETIEKIKDYNRKALKVGNYTENEALLDISLEIRKLEESE